MAIYNDKPYENANLNCEIYNHVPAKMCSYFKSVKYFLTKDYIKDSYTILDIGGAGGNLAYAINSEIANIEATIIDPDVQSIKNGKLKYPEIQFIQGYFPQDILNDLHFRHSAPS